MPEAQVAESEPARLTALANDPQLLGGADPPLFPVSLLAKEQRYVEAARARRATETASARSALLTALEAQLESDRRRLRELDPGTASRREGQFLHARAVVLEARRRSLTTASRVQPPAVPAPMRAPAHAPPPAPTPPPTPPAEGPEPRHRDDIQGLRAVAVVLVALGHAGVGFLAGGFVGVDVFFVLSGFLITGLLLSEARRRRYVSLAGFYLRRARRILPAATLTLIAGDVAAYHLLNFVRAKQYLQDSIASAFFTANIHFAAQGTDYFAQGQPPSPFQHFWSLAVEEQFYVVWPAVLVVLLGLALRRHAPRPELVSPGAIRRVLIVVAAIGLASLAWSIHYTARLPAAAYFSTAARAWELALGAALALTASRLARLPSGWRTGLGWGGLVGIAFAAVTFSSATPFPGYAALVPTLGAAAVIAAGVSAGAAPRGAGRVLGALPLRFVGDRSYAFYLWHWPVLVIAAQHAGHRPSVSRNLLLLAGAFALSMVSYALFEKPIRSATWARRPESLLPWIASVLGVVLLATTYISSINDHELRQRLRADNASSPALSLGPAPPRHRPRAHAHSTGSPPSQILPAVIGAVDSASHQPGMPAALNPPVGQLLDDVADLPLDCTAHDAETTNAICRLGSSWSSKTIVVIGDSHAEMWMPAVLSLAQRDSWAVVPLIKSGCSPSEWTGLTGTSDCHAWFRWAMQRGSALRPTVTLVTGYYSYIAGDDDQSLMNGLNAVVGGMKGPSRRVVILGDVPGRNRQPVDCLLAPHATAAGCSDSLSPAEAQITSLVAQLAAYDGVGFIDPTGWFCYVGQCPLVVSDIITYRDANHISQAYAAALGGAFSAAFRLATGRA